MAHITIYALNCLNESNFIDAMKIFVYQAQLATVEKDFYQQTMTDAKNVMILFIVSQIINDFENDFHSQALKNISDLVSITCLLLEKNDLIYRQVKVILENIYDNKDKITTSTEFSNGIKSFVHSMNTGNFAPTFDYMDFPVKFTQLLMSIENFDVYK